MFIYKFDYTYDVINFVIKITITFCHKWSINLLSQDNAYLCDTLKDRNIDGPFIIPPLSLFKYQMVLFHLEKFRNSL